MTERLNTSLCVATPHRRYTPHNDGGTLLCVAASRRPTLPAMTEKLNTLPYDYLSPVIASEQKGAKQSSYLSDTYVSLSNSDLLNKIIFCSVATFLDCFVAYAPRNDGETLLCVATSRRLRSSQ
jgi:hypothetical protein